MESILPLLGFLVVFPLLAAIVMLAVKSNRARGLIIGLCSLLIASATIALLIVGLNTPQPIRFAVGGEWLSYLTLGVSLLITVYILYAAFRDKKPGTFLVAAVQLLLTVGAEVFVKNRPEAEYTLLIDNLTLIMALLIGVVGGFICIFAIGYMADYHHHKQVTDRSRMFFAVIFVFISAMFGLVFCNDLMLLLFFWEITTFCSFLLIGYTRKEESIRNAYRALIMNLAGGIAFLGGIVWLEQTQHIVELDKLLRLTPELVMIPAVLFAFAGMVKSAQFPFTSWLLGAMVAPTPTSALLHSSTMVKAGVYIIIRLSPVLKDTAPGLLIALIGGLTFLLASLIAISKHNVKKLLAYSTVSTLGLIVLCAGVGTYQAIWTAILLMLFHAVAKSLLFLSVGTVEQGIESLNIEDMDGLIMKMPRVTLCLLIGIAGMFIAPFGMLISKWAALEALIKANPLLSLFVVFGSSATLFFYTKWMGKLIMVRQPPDIHEEHIAPAEWFTMGSLSVLTVLVCMGFPIISSALIDPYIRQVYLRSANMSGGNILIMLIMLGLVLLLPFQILLQSKQKKHVIAYLCGANVLRCPDTGEPVSPYEANRCYRTAAGQTQEVTLRNYYFRKVFGEEKLGRMGLVLSLCLLAVLFGVTVIL